MFAFPSMLVPAAQQAGISVPSDPDQPDQYRMTHPHFFVFCQVQLCRRIRPGEHFDNARIIASLSDDEIRRVTLADLIGAGLEWST